ncbi:MAG: hypothetical protein JXR56_01955 [Candidatus Cloacimonetes bacterium]|nr:hypothetical protein [Candidatus Cloacimonadota bacterium]
MKELLLDKELKNNIKTLPQKPGVFYFANEVNPLFVSLAGNLRGRIGFYLDKIKEDERISTLKDAATKIFWKQAPDNINALIWQKKLIKELEPVLQTQVKPYEDYCYLALDIEGDKQIQIKDDTQGEFFYIGPFRDRFFVADLMETFNVLLQITPQKKFSKDLMIETYLRSGSTFLSILEKRREDLFKDIKFEDSELMRKQIELLSRFYQYMIFYYTARHVNTTLDLDKNRITIRNGLISEIENEKEYYRFSHQSDIDYRDNEFLAVNKVELDELWIVFYELLNKKPEYITDLYQENIHKVLTMLKYKSEEKYNDDK